MIDRISERSVKIIPQNGPSIVARDAAIQRRQIHKARNIMDRLPKSMHASVRRVLRQAWEMDDAEKA